MIITQIALSDSAAENGDISESSLILASHTVESIAKLICCTWLQANESWKDSIKLSALSKRYHLDGLKVQFLAADQLNASNSEEQLLLGAIAQLQEYLQGTRRDFELAIDITSGTPFQKKVWQALQGIDHGQTISYATLAARVNNPKGFRAVANANGKNPLSIIIPCHRVIASDGKLGGYTGGVGKKQYLLALEGVACKV